MSTNMVSQQEIRKAIVRTNECMRLLMESELTEEDKQRVINSPEFRDKLVKYWKSRYKAVTVEIVKPISLLDLREAYGTGPNGFHKSYSSYFGKDFTMEKVQGIFEIDFEKQLTRKTFQEQCSELPEGWEIPHPTVLVAAYFKHMETAGEKFLGDFYSRTSKKISNDSHILIHSSLNGLVIDNDNDDGSYSDVGVAPQRTKKELDTGQSLFKYMKDS